MSIRIGTASWADKALIDTGRFYPSDVTTAEGQLRYYARHFPLVEVDSSYYAIPDVRAARQWAERTPDGFVMNVKAFRLFQGIRRRRLCCPLTCETPSPAIWS